MKKSFKTIMALVSMLAISMSGISMTSADEDPTPPPTTQSVTINGDSTTGEFNAVDPIPVTFNAEHVLSVTIDFGDMAISYDLTDTSEANNYGWGDSFDGENNKLTVTNNSTCPVSATIYLNIDTETYPFLEEFDFKFSCYYNPEPDDYYYTGLWSLLTYPGDPRLEESEPNRRYTSEYYYLTALNKNSTDMADMHNYNFNNAKIGQFTITLEPCWQTL